MLSTLRARLSAGATVLATTALAALAQSAGAVELGPLDVLSTLGEPLHVRAPVQLAEGEQLRARCVRLRGGDAGSRALNLRFSLDRRGGAPAIVIESRNPVTQPQVELTVAIGCEDSVKREYAVTLTGDSQAANARNAGAVIPTAAQLPVPPRLMSTEEAEAVLKSHLEQVSDQIAALRGEVERVSQHAERRDQALQSTWLIGMAVLFGLSLIMSGLLGWQCVVLRRELALARLALKRAEPEGTGQEARLRLVSDAQKWAPRRRASAAPGPRPKQENVARAHPGAKE